jgi:hypothetical protein
MKYKKNTKMYNVLSTIRVRIIRIADYPDCGLSVSDRKLLMTNGEVGK